MTRRVVLAGMFMGSMIAAAVAQQSAVANLKTTAESSAFKSTSTHAEVVAFMKAIDTASPDIHYTVYGKTFEGREMPMAVVGRGLKDASPESVRATGRLRVHIQGNIHAGEVEGKESAQILLREIALGQHRDWLDSMVLLVTPIFNADGNERFGDNRGTQNGPINGMGTRANAQNLNINRDFTKLETPEGRAFVKLWNDYDPHVGFDLHTSNGSNHAYHLTYSPPLHPNTNDAIMNLMKGEWFPFITRQVKTKHGWDMFYYGNASGGGGGRGGRGRGGDPDAAAGGRGEPPATPPPAAPPAVRSWGTFEHVPRFHNNYVGMRNRFALLSEAYSYATFEDRIKATNYFIEEALNFAHTHADRLKQIVAAADAESLVGRPQATRAAIRTGGLIEILMGEVEPEINPNTKRNMNRRVNVSKPEMMFDRLWFSPTWNEDVAAAYYVPAKAEKALELLRAHGIRMQPAKAPASGLEQFVITSNTTRPGGRGGGPSIDTGTHELRTVNGYWQPSTAALPAGTLEVPMDQPLARLAFILLAPTSDDGLLNWNFLDELLTTGANYPILRRR